MPPQLNQVPPVQQFPPSAPVPPVAPQPTGQKKSNVGMVIAIIILLLILIGGGIFAYLYFGNASNRSVVATPTNDVAKTTPTKVPGTWQEDVSKKRLCWDGFQPACKEALTGYQDVYNVLDIKGDGSVLLGAIEYCQYLNPDGITIDKTAQNFWRLPTANELVAKFNSDKTSFHYLDTGYWSISTDGDGISPGQADYMRVLSDGNFSSGYLGKNNAFYVRCIQ